MITINQLQKKFGEKTAVNIENYTINQGEMLGLVGNNGAGKTTLFRLILDLLQATAATSPSTGPTSARAKTGKPSPAPLSTTASLSTI